MGTKITGQTNEFTGCETTQAEKTTKQSERSAKKIKKTSGKTQETTC
jgi:hypothetical protein